MRIGGIQYSLAQKAYDIYLTGCSPPYCEGCHNPQLHDFECGNPLNYVALAERMENYADMFDKIRLMGGEPFDQPVVELRYLLEHLDTCFPDKEIWVFTKYTYEELTRKQKELFMYIDIGKHGRYRKDLGPYTCGTTGVRLASSNQYIHRHLKRRPPK